MTINNAVSATAGVVIIISLLLGAQEISPFAYNSNWLWLTVFVGFNLFQSAFTGFCPAAIIAKKLGAK
ncbi:MAG: DUF2892 domain-containing protein [Candidatus Vesicomyosocius endoextente]|uniref:DUF2892 domain-containing protein n=1 Tax=Candidatus Vesicomyosocius endoextente TaxID=2738853 RepID=A0A853GD30_9GAMM|nr:DUF2892 domain-containing protein [Candidatus Vesicomyosocius endoextente]